jgi:hypothetical protein
MSVNKVFRAVAVACDTTHCPGLTDGQPRQTIICIAINQIVDPLPQGGRMKASECVRPKRQVTVVGRDKGTVKWALGEYIRASKHGESPTHERVDLFQDKESNKVQTTMDRPSRRRRKRANSLPRDLAQVRTL